MRKVDAGARFLLSQPVYDVDPLRRLRETYERVAGRPLDVPILAGVLPIHSARHAEFLHNEVPGVVIPGTVRERLASRRRRGVAGRPRDGGASSSRRSARTASRGST